MKANLRNALIAVFALVILLVTSWHATRSHLLKPTALRHPEMDRLQALYLGTWDYRETYAESPFSPQDGHAKGVHTRELGPGGFLIINRFHSQRPIADAEGLLVMTWDPKRPGVQVLCLRQRISFHDCANRSI